MAGTAGGNAAGRGEEIIGLEVIDGETGERTVYPGYDALEEEPRSEDRYEIIEVVRSGDQIEEQRY
jgi:hypothetical protein